MTDQEKPPTIYVDDAMIAWRGNRWCHLFCDGPTAQLHEFAARMGLRLAWFQDKVHPHYDVTPTVRERAIRNGAQPIVWRECGPVLRRIAEIRRAEKEAMWSQQFAEIAKLFPAGDER
jgi:hypothetical protein